MRMLAFDCTGQVMDAAIPLIGNMLVDLGLAMGVFDQTYLDTLNHGDEVHVRHVRLFAM